MLKHPHPPNTTNPKRDHLVDPISMGRPLGMHGKVLGEEDEEEDALEVNTEPTMGLRGGRSARWNQSQSHPKRTAEPAQVLRIYASPHNSRSLANSTGFDSMSSGMM
ncbi:hypothetical protein [Mesorhizobium loti]|uniref:hypothetical protein n=1 Tax=Rhizobium loti TaxID=381 RepID=UPI00040719E3|nr:hypothetical protein [Mesorhizobium loti]